VSVSVLVPGGAIFDRSGYSDSRVVGKGEENEGNSHEKFTQ
jgi:hypothetical protein